jgi:hypothetical protein
MNAPSAAPAWIPSQLLDAALDELRTWGEKGRESIVLLLGKRTNQRVRIRTVVLAEPPGVERGPGFVRLTEEWMLQLTACCEQLGEAVLAQMHAHPLGPQHSSTDNHHLVHAPGIMSIVVPDYARRPSDGAEEDWATYVGVSGGTFSLAHLTEPFEIADGAGRVLLLSESGWRDAPA